MIWGGISWLGKTDLYVITGKFKGLNYRQLLTTQKQFIKRMFRNEKSWWFQQDSAPAHKDKDSIKFIKRNLTRNILPHPAQSPDLNPIEFVWAKMKKQVESAQPRNKEELKNEIFRSWESIDIKFIRKCISGSKKNNEENYKK